MAEGNVDKKFKGAKMGIFVPYPPWHKRMERTPLLPKSSPPTLFTSSILTINFPLIFFLQKDN